MTRVGDSSEGWQWAGWWNTDRSLGGRIAVDHASALCHQEQVRASWWMTFSMICGGCLGVEILGDLPKRPGGTVGWEKDVQGIRVCQ